MRFSAPSIGWGSRRAWRKPFWTWTENLWPSSAPMLGSTDEVGGFFRWHALVLRIVPAAACSWPCWWAVNSLWDSWEVVEPYSVKVGKREKTTSLIGCWEGWWRLLKGRLVRLRVNTLIWWKIQCFQNSFEERFLRSDGMQVNGLVYISASICFIDLLGNSRRSGRLHCIGCRRFGDGGGTHSDARAKKGNSETQKMRSCKKTSGEAKQCMLSHAAIPLRWPIGMDDTG